MAKSPTEQIRDLALEVRALKERDAAHERELDSFHNELSELKADLAKEREARVASQMENTAVKQQLQDHIAQYQEGDRRRWSLIVLLVGAVLLLASGLIVTLVKK
ncbi:MAG: hypothetical protein L0241_15225 [Planctomycetia bacterium]|nr:hypothetical protein [Planctomycetia bacterium]